MMRRPTPTSGLDDFGRAPGLLQLPPCHNTAVLPPGAYGVLQMALAGHLLGGLVGPHAVGLGLRPAPGCALLCKRCRGRDASAAAKAEPGGGRQSRAGLLGRALRWNPKMKVLSSSARSKTAAAPLQTPAPPRLHAARGVATSRQEWRWVAVSAVWGVSRGLGAHFLSR